MDESSYSSFYSSFLRTETSSNEDNDKMSKQGSIDKKPWRRPEPPWLDNVAVTPDLIYRYKVTTKSISDVLMADKLKLIHQPSLVNDQLDQLYLEMELEGLSAKLCLSERNTSSGSSGSEEDSMSVKNARRRTRYGKLVMIYEENAPLPPPIEYFKI